MAYWVKLYLYHPPLSQILCFSSPSDSNPQFPETFLAMQLPPELFWEDAKEDLYKICISRQKCILIKVKINIKRIHELNFNPILFHLKVVPYGQTKIQNLCKRKEQNPYKFYFCNKRKYIQLDYKISKQILEYLWGSWEVCCNIPSMLKYNLTNLDQ